MQATKVSFFHHLAKRIHQPYMDKQKASQLLTVLTKTFHAQLAKQANSSHAALDNHFDSILHNPFFTKSSVHHHSSIAPLNLTALNYFRLELQQGVFNERFLLNYLTHLTKSLPAASPTQKSSGVPAKILDLLLAHNVQDLNSNISLPLIKLLVRDKAYSSATEWIIKSDSSKLFGHYIEQCIKQRDIEFAIKAVLQIVPRLSSGSAGSGMIVVVDHLLSHSPDSAEISNDVYQRLLGESKKRALSSLSLSSSQFVYSIFALLHPDRSRSDSNLALEYFNNSASSPPRHPKARIHLLQLALKLAERLILEEKYTDASSVLSYARERFPLELGLTSMPKSVPNSLPKSTPSQQDQADVLNRLGGLLST